MKEYLNKLPGPADLLKKYREDRSVPEVNAHLHSPWSFCAFENIEQMFGMAREEGIAVLGINDFYTVDGYGEFAGHALRNRVFPLFNIEFMGLMKDLQEEDIRVNDPNNPGRTYFSGKGLKYPAESSEEYRAFLQNLQAQSQEQVRQMCDSTAELLAEIHAPFGISYEAVRSKFARNLVRERHIARALREASYANFPDISVRLDFYERLFGGRKLNASLNDLAGVENEIRSVILKKGGRAFVPEDSDAYPDLGQIIGFILDAGGIPCYPVLLDDRAGNITRFEGDWDRMHEVLQSHGVSCLELIPQRNSLEKLKEFVNFFLQKKYVIAFGTEHNTPELFPLTVKVEKDRDLPQELKEVSYRGACVFAAHQYLVARGEEGFIKKNGRADTDNLEFYRDLGHAVIREFNGPSA